VVSEFNRRISQADLPGLTALMTASHVFVDTEGVRIQGREQAAAAWAAFFAHFPGYWNEFQHVVPAGDTVVAAGRSHCSDQRLDGAALWRAVVQSGQVALWQVYRDTLSTRRALGLSKEPGTLRTQNDV
jgi:ketosteroid isomerase-like protein